MKRVLGFIFFLLFLASPCLATREAPPPTAAPKAVAVLENSASSIGNSSIFGRSFSTGSPLVLVVLLILMFMSVATWAILFSKWLYLRKLEKRSSSFLRAFVDARSLKELHGRLDEHSYSPLREVFKMGYAELLKNSHLKEQTTNFEMGVGAAMDNLKRNIHKTKLSERRQLERFLSFLAISASSCPFIGLFGTVWGIMSAFEGIAQSGSTSLATVAPGISEALIATAFGLAAAIPAVIAYNIASNKIRGIMSTIDLFTADFLNIVERFFVSDRKPSIDHARTGPGV